ncbi:MAG: FAD-binding oxidoreductase [Candidatus Binataceae bacterium]
MDLKTLRDRVEGDVTANTDAAYESLRSDMVWNLLRPARRPELIVRAANERDVAEAIGFASSNRMKLAVRGGGHSWCGFSLRDGGLLIDLSRLNQIVINPAARTAAIQPSVSSRDFSQRLSAHNLSFPVGHCPLVPMSGFLLNGGLGFNSNAWGPACLSIEAAEVITADGNTVTASPERNPDLFWAIRGGGPGFFGVITKYFLKVYPAPHSIIADTWFLPLERIAEVGNWAESAARKIAKEVELSVLLTTAPPDLAAQCESSNGFVCVVSAIAFVGSQTEAAAALEPVASSPFERQCLKSELNQETSFDALLDLGGQVWPERHRYLADTLWSNSSLAEILTTLRDHFLKSPSPKALAACVLHGSAAQAGPFPDAAFSMLGDVLVLCYAIWDRPVNDPANAAWHKGAISALDQYAAGHYVGESDIAADPLRAERSFTPETWRRLESLRQKYDPDRIFQGHFRAGQ